MADNIDIAYQLQLLSQSTNGAAARSPIAEMLNTINESGGNVDGIVDDDGQGYGLGKIYTPDQVNSFFKNGVDNGVYLDRWPKKTAERKMAVSSQFLYRQLLIMSNTLSKIIGDSTTPTEEP